MKKILIYLIVILAIASSCRYKEGPAISFHSVKDRLNGKWEVIEYTSDGIDSLQYYKDSCGCGLEFRTDQSEYLWNFSFQHCQNTGADWVFDYSFSKNKTIMNIWFGIYPDHAKGFGPMLIETSWKILRLTKNDFKITAFANDHNYVVVFKKIN